MHARAKNGNGNGANIVAEAMDAAEGAGLRYVSDDRPGYTRKANGEEFKGFDAEGKLIRDEQRLLRNNRLVIPPALTEVLGSSSLNSHIPATVPGAPLCKHNLY